MVTVNHNLAGLAFVDANRQRHLLPMTTMRAILRCVAWIHFLKLTASIFSFAFEYRKESRPRHIGDGFREMTILYHLFDVQVFNCNSVKAIDQLHRFLMVKIFSCSPHFQISECNSLPGFSAIGRAAFFARKSALELGQILRSIGQMARVFYMLASRKSGEVFDANINSDTLASFRKRFSLTNLTGQQCIPAVYSSRDAYLFHAPLNWTAKSDATKSNAWNVKFVFTQWTNPNWFKFYRKTVIAGLTLKARKSFFLVSAPYPFIKILKRSIYALQGVFLYCPKVISYVGQTAGICQVSGLFGKKDLFSGKFIATNALFKSGVVDLTRMFEFALARFYKRPIRSYLVFKSLDDCGTTLVSHCVQRLNRCARWLGLKGRSNALSSCSQYTTAAQDEPLFSKRYSQMRPSCGWLLFFDWC